MSSFLLNALYIKYDICNCNIKHKKLTKKTKNLFIFEKK